MINNNTSLKIVFVCIIICIGSNSYCQEFMHSQSVVKQEYLNPAYNSFKNYISVNLFSRNQWDGVEEHPRILGANFFMPIHVGQLGVGLTLLKEDIGLRSVSSFCACLTHNLKISRDNYLSLGYGVGGELTSYNQDKIIAQSDDYLNYDIKWKSFHPAIKLGVFYTNPYLFAGLSSNTVIGKDKSQKWSLPGFDFIGGVMYDISESVFFMPDLVIKYYRCEKIDVGEPGVSSSYVPPVFDLSARFLIRDRVWLSTSHRFNHAHTFSVDFWASSNLLLGYSFELGIGDGLNQFNSNTISIAYKIDCPKIMRGFQRGFWYHRESPFKNLYR